MSACTHITSPTASLPNLSIMYVYLHVRVTCTLDVHTNHPSTHTYLHPLD
jgi:hypothetical protein